MNRYQTNRVTMFNSVADYLGGHNSVWNGMAPFATAVQAFKDDLDAIAMAVKQQETPTGVADIKANTRDDLEEVVFLVSQALTVLGHTNSDEALLAVTELSSSTLERMPDDELLTRANVVMERAFAKKTDLATLQVTQANLDELSHVVDAFVNVMNQPRGATADRGTQTATLASLIRHANSILRDQIDRMVSLFSRTDPQFVDGYRRHRVVVDRAATLKPAKTAGTAPPNPHP